MKVSDERYNEFYSELDVHYLSLDKLSFEQFCEGMLILSRNFDREASEDVCFALEMNRELASRRLIGAIEKDLGIQTCLNLLKECDKYDYQDPSTRWLILVQVFNYLKKFNRCDLIAKRLNEISEDLETLIEESQDSLKRVRQAILDIKNEPI